MNWLIVLPNVGGSSILNKLEGVIFTFSRRLDSDRARLLLFSSTELGRVYDSLSGSRGESLGDEKSSMLVCEKWRLIRAKREDWCLLLCLWPDPRLLCDLRMEETVRLEQEKIDNLLTFYFGHHLLTDSQYMQTDKPVLNDLIILDLHGVYSMQLQYSSYQDDPLMYASVIAKKNI